MTLGEFEELTLLAVVRLDGSAYGVAVQGLLTEATGQPLSAGAVYTTLARLEEKGLVASRVGEPESRRGGRAKRMYRVTAAGVRALAEAERVREWLRE